MKTMHISKMLFYVIVFMLSGTVSAQFKEKIKWAKGGHSVFELKDGKKISERKLTDSVAIRIYADLTDVEAINGGKAIDCSDFYFSQDQTKLLIFANAEKVWRFKTKGEYWVYFLKEKRWQKLGNGLPKSSLMFAKFSPSGKQVAYVSENNLYLEELDTHKKTVLTNDGDSSLFNGVFDWAYQEEFGAQDGFRWSPDGRNIAYWKIDAKSIREFSIINNTDSIYPTVKKIKYAKAGLSPSKPSINIINIQSMESTRVPLPEHDDGSYIPRMEWAPGSQLLVVQQLSRRQNESHIYAYNLSTKHSTPIFHEKSSSWIDVTSAWNNFDPSGWEWVRDGKEFIWISEKDGWRKLYRIDLKGHVATLTPGSYDVMDVYLVDQQAGYIYFSASLQNATERYCYRVKLSGSEPEQISTTSVTGVHHYQFSPNGKQAVHSFVTTTSSIEGEIVEIPSHTILAKSKQRDSLLHDSPRAEFFKIVSQEGVEMDGWMVKPKDFDPRKKYPVLFYVYGEPADASVVVDYKLGLRNPLYQGKMYEDGYIYMAVENRGTPVPKGKEWRSAIYGQIGSLNIRDQAEAAKEIRKWPFVDSTRIAVWGMSGGGSTTLNLLFQYPEIYTTGIALSAITDMRTYDNIYQERYMGIPFENAENYRQGSAVIHASKLKGKLLYIHGTADDNVHFQNCELLVNELIKHNKQFELMIYPNRSHSFSEGEGTFQHLSSLFTTFLRKNCPPGGR